MTAPTLILDIALMTMLVVVAFAIVRMRSLFAIVMLQGVYSLLCAAWFVSLDAVDVAFTEAAVGAGVSTVLMLAAMLLADRKSRAVPVHRQLGPLLVTIIAGAAMFYAIGDMPAYGDADSPANAYVGIDYIERTAEEIHIPNVVTAVLASYRGYDTFGETVVIFAAGLGVLLLLGLNGNAGRWHARPTGVRVCPPAAPSARLAPTSASIPVATAPSPIPSKPAPVKRARRATSTEAKSKARKPATKPSGKQAGQKKPATKKTAPTQSKSAKSKTSKTAKSPPKSPPKSKAKTTSASRAKPATKSTRSRKKGDE